MALDIWSSSYDQDLIEEDALNEKFCVRVLRILITKADTEIEELEKDLLSLQNELALSEHDKCCSALTEKINWLEDAIGTLKNGHADDTEVQLLLHNKPAETLHEIVEAFQGDHCQDTYGQQLDVNILDSSVNVAENALDKESNNIDSNIIIKYGGKELGGTSGNSRSSKLLLELHENRSDEPEKIELSHVDIKCPCNDASKDAMSMSIEKKQSSIPAMTMSLVIKKDNPTLVPDTMSPCSVLIPKEKGLDSSKGAKELLAKPFVMSADLGANSCAPVHSDGMKLLGTSGNIFTGNEEVSRSQLTSTDTGQILTMFYSKVNSNFPREAKHENAIVEDKGVSSDAFRLSTGIKGRKMSVASRVGALQQQKTGNSDIDKKLCDLAPKSVRRGCKKESKVAPAEDLDSMSLPLQVVYPQDLCLADDTEPCSFKGSDGKNSRHLMNIQNVSLIHAENSASISKLDLQIKSALYTGSQLTDEEKPQAQGLNSKFAANLSKLNMGFPSKLKAQGKRKLELEAFSARELHDSRIEVIPNTSTVVKPKRQRKSRTSTDGASLNESMNTRITKRAAQPGSHETEDRAIVLYDSKFSELQKKRASHLPITLEIKNSTVYVDLANSDRISIGNGSQVDLQSSKSYALVESHNETSALLPITLKSMTLSDLRSIAKQHNIRKYYKLPKAALVELLVEQLTGR